MESPLRPDEMAFSFVFLLLLLVSLPTGKDRLARPRPLAFFSPRMKKFRPFA